MECCSESQQGQELSLPLTEWSFSARFSAAVMSALENLSDNFTISDPCICGHPIVFASRGFPKMSVYSKEEVIGCNGRIFQGPATCKPSVMVIREAIREEKAVVVSLLNYRKDGSPFWMLFQSRCAPFLALPMTGGSRISWWSRCRLSGTAAGGGGGVLVSRRVCAKVLVGGKFWDWKSGVLIVVRVWVVVRFRIRIAEVRICFCDY